MKTLKIQTDPFLIVEFSQKYRFSKNVAMRRA